MNSQIIIKHFWCKTCSQYWQTDDFIESDDSCLSLCPKCSEQTNNVPHYYANLAKMKDNASGPKTTAGKKRSSLNSYKHGNYSKQARTLAPALKGKYAECEGCEFDYKCEHSYKYCPVRLQPMLRFLQAFEDGDPSALKQFAGMAQAKTFSVLTEAFANINQNGIMFETPKFDKFGKELKTEDDELVIEKSLNPSIKIIPEFMTVLGFSSDQQQMNPRTKIENDEDLKGNLDKQGQNVTDFLGSISSLVNQAMSAPKLAAELRAKHEKEQTESKPDQEAQSLDNPFENGNN